MLMLRELGQWHAQCGIAPEAGARTPGPAPAGATIVQHSYCPVVLLAAGGMQNPKDRG
jgi:hypothetical protein